MNKKFIFLAISLIACVSSYAVKERQLSKNEIAVSYGLFPYSDVIESSKDVDEFHGFNEVEGTTTGAINFTYNHRFNPILGLGFEANYSGSKSQWQSHGMKVADKSVFYISFMPRLKGEWIHNKYFVLYSSVAVGAMWKRTTNKSLFNKPEDAGGFFDEFENQIKNDVRFAFQVSPIGLEFGNHVGGFIEGGFGQMGIVQAGLRFRW